MGTSRKFTRPWFASCMVAAASAPSPVRMVAAAGAAATLSSWLGSASAASSHTRRFCMSFICTFTGPVKQPTVHSLCLAKMATAFFLSSGSMPCHAWPHQLSYR